MAVAVVDVGVVRMAVHQRLVPMPVGVRLTYRVLRVVRVPVVLVVHVQVLVLHPLVVMLVLVALGDVQPNAHRHERRTAPDEHRRPLVKEHD